ncbi:MAG: tyrosine--tRNA ligase [Candidatus Paceibacterota bacterium]
MDKQQKINELLTRGVEDVFVKESLEKKLASGQKLRVKLGFDPTGSKIHIGRAIVLRKLKAFQDLGHQIIFLVGDVTAQIGDPSDKLEKRPMLSKEKIEENLKDYKNQVAKIINIEKAEFCFNSEWLSNLKFEEIAELAETFSVGQMIARRNFKERMEKGQEVSLREFLYPLMQGYDSVMLKADVEIGGFDQLFNLKAGRIIQKHYGQPEQDVLTTEMLEGTDGRKMSTSWGNVINITDEPNDMYGKVMSVKDELIEKYFVLCTELPMEEIKKVMEAVKNGGNPRDAKMRLAKEIVALYHGKEKSEKAELNFVETFKKGGIPEDAPEIKAKKDEMLSELMLKEKIVKSKTEWRRLIDEGAVMNMESEEKITDYEFKVSKNIVLKVGKRRFAKIVIGE